MSKLSPRARSVIAWAIVVPWALWALVRLPGLERSAPLVQLMAFTPYVVLVALAATAVSGLMRRWAPTAVGALAATALLLVVAPRVIADGDPAVDGPEVRVMSANIFKSEADLGRVLELVRREGVDLLSVQELTPRATAWLRRHGLDRMVPHRVLADRPSVYGSGIFARFPLRGHGFSPAEFRQPSALMNVPGAPRFDVVCVHPIPPTRGRTVKSWRESLRELPGTGQAGVLRLLVGDFNATLDHDELREVLDRGYRDAGEAEGAGLIPTWPSGRNLVPPVTIDHILADERIAIDDYEVHDVPGTDHRAVLATLVLPSDSTR